ncbi:probable cytochrome P450 6a14 isoform X1 [Anoplolepis gracilipes]|uniref:probable cytochrome P450 6a14 isoform X1 n=2 Tax=Anoplolepis gracilipes TaxID=354296 RepID=UPI003B9DEF28
MTELTMVLVELIAIFIAVLIVIYIYYKYVVFNYWRKKGVFYVEPVVPTGNIGSLVASKISIGQFFHDLYIKYKDHRAFGIYAFFKPNLIITDPELIRVVLTKEFKHFHDRGIFSNEKIDPLTGNLFLLPGKKWWNLRVKMTPTFTLGKIKPMFAIVKMCGDELISSVENVAQTEDCIEIKDWFGRYTTDIIMSIAFGIKSKCIEEGDNEIRYWGKKIFEVHPLWTALSAFTPQVMKFFSIPATSRGVTKFVIKTFRENMEYRQTHKIVKHDFMNLLIQLMEKGYVESDDKDIDKSSTTNVNKLTLLQAIAQAYSFFAAGFETSSTTATFCLYELAQQQDLQDKLCKEIDETLKKHDELTYNALNEMTYLHKVINETLRKYPPLPILNRICTEEINLPTTNIHVPKGMTISIPLLGLHRDPSIYPEPDKFDPERFNRDKIAARHPYAYLPFGGGPRICIGSKFGYIQTKVGIVSLLSRFKFKLDPRTTVPVNFIENHASLTAKDSIYLTIEPR